MRKSGTDDDGSAAKPLVSVIIPTRNRAHCLPRALDSVYAQEGLGTLFDLEVIVVDDASSDVVATLRTCPEALGHEPARGRVGEVASWRMLRAKSPMCEARDLCAQINTTLPGRGLRARWWRRLTVARVWMELARFLTFSPRASARRDAAYAALCALVQAPTLLFQAGLVRVIIRSILGRGADAWFLKIHRWVSRVAVVIGWLGVVEMRSHS